VWTIECGWGITKKLLGEKGSGSKKGICASEMWAGIDSIPLKSRHGWNASERLKKLSLDARTRKSRHVEKDSCEEKDTLEERMHARSGSISLEGIHVRGSAAALQNGCDVKKDLVREEWMKAIMVVGGLAWIGYHEILDLCEGFWVRRMVKSELERIQFLQAWGEWNAQGRKKFECQHQSQKSSHMEKGLDLKNGMLR
jgi:hypothetical protein